MAIIAIPEPGQSLRYDTHEGHFYGPAKYPSVSKIKDMLRKDGLENWRYGLILDNAIQQCAGLHATVEGQGMDEQVFVGSAKRRIGSGRKDLEIASKAAAVGSAVHAYAEWFLSGGEGPTPVVPDDVDRDKYEARKATLSLWLNTVELNPVFLEHPLVSDKNRVGGTPDYYGVVDGKWTIADLKTGSMPKDAKAWKDQELQLGGYAVLFKEQYPDRPLDQLMIIGLALKKPKVVVIEGDKMQSAMMAFELAAQMYWWWNS